MVRTLVLFTAEDNKELQYGYGRATECSGVRTMRAPQTYSPAPDIDQMAADLESMGTLSKRLTTRQSSLRRNDLLHDREPVIVTCRVWIVNWTERMCPQ